MNNNSVETLEKGRLLKEVLKIVNELGKNDLAEIDGEFTSNDFDYENLQKLIVRARNVRRNRWWDLK